MSIKLASNDSITATALLRKISLFFFLFASHDSYYTQDSDWRWLGDEFPTAAHPTMWRGDYLP